MTLFNSILTENTNNKKQMLYIGTFTYTNGDANFLTIVLHFTLSFFASIDSQVLRPVQSCMLSDNVILGRPILLVPFTVPLNMTFDIELLLRLTCPCHGNFRSLTFVSRFLCGPIVRSILFIT